MRDPGEYWAWDSDPPRAREINIDASVACENPVARGRFLPHDWRLIGERIGPDRVEQLGGGDYATHRTIVRRWYCTRCRKIEATNTLDA